MKKAYLFAATLLCGASLLALTVPVHAQVDTEVGEIGGSISCYGRYDSGTTTFTKCNGCIETTGSNVQDKEDCKPN